jgi:hypothetical protein
MGTLTPHHVTTVIPEGMMSLVRMYWSYSAVHGSPGDSVTESLSPPESESASRKSPLVFCRFTGRVVEAWEAWDSEETELS